MSIQDKLEKELFPRWKDMQNECNKKLDKSEALKLPDLSHFIPDGIIERESYDDSSPKVLYILKESNAGDDCKDGFFWFRDVEVANNGRHRITVRISRMQELIAKGSGWNGVAYMNINKCGGGSSTNPKMLKKYVEIPGIRDCIRKEIMLLKPDHIICCGSGIEAIVKDALENESAMAEKIVSMWHPSIVRSHEAYMNEFKARWKEFRKKRKATAG